MVNYHLLDQACVNNLKGYYQNRNLNFHKKLSLPRQMKQKRKFMNKMEIWKKVNLTNKKSIL